MKDSIDHIIIKLDKIEDRLSNIDNTLVRNTVSLEEHMRRTELLEQDVVPIKEHVLHVKSGIKVAKVISSVIVALFGIGLTILGIYIDWKY